MTRSGVTFDRVIIGESLAEFLYRPFDGAGRQVWVPELDRTKTLVLGSSQPDRHVDLGLAASHDVAIERRRSGGGAVLVSADDLVWFDVIIERGDALWSDDIGRAFEWLGATVARGLDELGHPSAVHTGAQTAGRWSSRVCFAGVGSGEVTIDGAKVVGMSQRRSRNAARFQVAVLRRWESADYTALLSFDDEESRRAATIELRPVALGIPEPACDILDAVLGALPE